METDDTDADASSENEKEGDDDIIGKELQIPKEDAIPFSGEYEYSTVLLRLCPATEGCDSSLTLERFQQAFPLQCVYVQET